jgi:hypothetical protein
MNQRKERRGFTLIELPWKENEPRVNPVTSACRDVPVFQPMRIFPVNAASGFGNHASAATLLESHHSRDKKSATD